MAKRFERYQLKPGDDIGEPDFLNNRFEDIDNRIHTQELKGQEIDEAAADIERVALSRLDDVFTGILIDAQEKLRDTGAWFRAESLDELYPATGALNIVLTEATRGGFVTTPNLLIVSASDDTHYMVTELVSYVPLDGVLSVTVTAASGETAKSDWLIYPIPPENADHLARMDNPHGVTKAQVGLGNVDNTSDADKPISAAQQAALNAKADDAVTAAALAGKQDALGFTPIDKAGDTGIGNLELLEASFARFGHANQVDGDDGKIGAGLFGEGLNIVGVQTLASSGRKIRAIGDVTIDSGYLLQPEVPHFYAHGLASNTGNQVPALFQNTRANQGNHYNSANGQFTAPVDGSYLFMAHGRMNPFSGVYLHFGFWVNGGNWSDTFTIQGSYGSPNGYVSCATQMIVPLSEGDYVIVSFHATSSSGGVLDPSQCRFMGMLIG